MYVFSSQPPSTRPGQAPPRFPRARLCSLDFPPHPGCSELAKRPYSPPKLSFLKRPQPLDPASVLTDADGVWTLRNSGMLSLSIWKILWGGPQIVSYGDKVVGGPYRSSHA